MNNVEFLKINFDAYNEPPHANLINAKKKICKLLSTARASSKGDQCFYCGKNVSSFCNSHTIPAFCLKNISVDGKVFYFNKFMEIPFMDFDKGIKQAGTFNIICRECDSVIFHEYEDPSNYAIKPTSRMLAQIAMKNYLKAISKRLNEHAIFDIKKQNPLLLNSGLIESYQSIQNLDLNEYKNNFKKAKKLSFKNWDNEYYLFCYEKLNYVVPIAFQSTIALIIDLDKQIVNDIYYQNIKYRIEDFHICIFPLQDTSIVMMFVDKNYKRYRNFYKKFRKLPLQERLSIINYIIFLYSEDMFLSKALPENIYNNDNLINIARQTTIAVSNTPFSNAIEAAKEAYDLNKHNTIPNLLSQKYKVR